MIEKVVAAFDYDMTVVWGPPSIRALRARKNGVHSPLNFAFIPSLETINASISETKSTGMLGIILGGLHSLVNLPIIRPIRKDALRTLDRIENLKHAENLLLRTAILSGRQPEGQKMMKKQLEDKRLKGKFDILMLNPGIQTYLWKMFGVGNWIDKGNKVVVFEDDWVAAYLDATFNNPLYPEDFKVLAYVLENASNRRLSPERRQMLANMNVFIVPNLIIGALDYEVRFRTNNFSANKLLVAS